MLIEFYVLEVYERNMNLITWVQTIKSKT